MAPLPQTAIEDYDEAIRLNPQYADAYNKRGIAYGDLGQYERAIEDWDEAIRLDPQYGNAYYNRGIAYGYLGLCFRMANLLRAVGFG